MVRHGRLTGTVPHMSEQQAPEPVSEPLGDDDEVVAQQNVGRDNMQGGGEWPDPDTPPSESAPG